jgi:hypothetical protein
MPQLSVLTEEAQGQKPYRFEILNNFVYTATAIPQHVELGPSEDGQLTETCKGDKYLQIESDWTASAVILLVM